MGEERITRNCRSSNGGRSVSNADLKEDEEVSERERRRRKAKSTLDLRSTEDVEEDHAETRLKTFINFFRNLRPSKEKQADQVISLVPEDDAVKKRIEKAEEKEEKATIANRYRNWRDRRTKSKIPDEEKKKKNPKSEETNGFSEEDSEREMERRKRKKKKRRKGSIQCDASDLFRDDFKPNGNQCNSSLELDSFSDLSIDNLELPQENSNRDLDHRIQTVKHSARKPKKASDWENEDSEADSVRLSKQRKKNAFDLDLDDDSGKECGSSGRLSTLNRWRQRFHFKSKETTLENFNSEAGEGAKKVKKEKKKVSDEEDAASIRTDRSVKSSVSKSSKKKKKKRKEAEDSEDSDPEVIVEESTWLEDVVKKTPEMRNAVSKLGCILSNFHAVY